ncbi:amidase family protein [Jiella mangrovi]|uniref:Amidase n=1 Tax=Jiella mangrovi TaxID=2821407 RepID=A0ABS4BM63_9HYPH|nr:amidase [Jiella mangrovi]MBP0617746.1 amidase [Jiella mangrovi]
MIDDMIASAISRDVWAGRRSAGDILRRTLARVARHEPQVAAFGHFDPARLDAEAAALSGRSPRGVLAGVPVAVDDVIATSDMPPVPGLREPSGAEAACVAALRRAGAVVVGKTRTGTGTGSGRAPRNPRDLDRSPGQPSGGSAAAVAAGMAAIGVATQHGGSAIGGASYCGIYGYMPSWGSVPADGLNGRSPTCNTVGFFARSAEDFTLIADVCRIDAAPCPGSIAGLRLGLCIDPPGAADGDPAVGEGIRRGAARLRAAGAEIVEIGLPPLFDGLREAYRTIRAREGGIVGSFAAAARPSAGSARAAYQLADACRAEFDLIQSGVDALLAPSADREAPIGPEDPGAIAINTIWALMQVPVVSVPGLCGPDGMPIGVSIICRRDEDRTALAIAHLVGQRLRPKPTAAAEFCCA